MKTIRHRARLIEDGGKSAEEEEFFRSAEFMAAEGVTHTLEIEANGGALRAPLKVEPIESGGLDATSPYGYPGFSGSAEIEIDPSEIDFSDTDLIAIFMRHRVGSVPLRGSTPRQTVYVNSPGDDFEYRLGDGQQIKRNLDAGYSTRLIPGPETSEADRIAFLDVYIQSMVRLKAAERYFYDGPYVEQVLSHARSHLAIAEDGDGAIVAASLITESDGFIHYYLTGIATSHVDESPAKNIVRALIDMSRDRAIPLCLGGGMAEDDTLAEFKRGFANREERNHTSEIVCDPEAYRALSAAYEEDTDFFPAYRTGSSES